MQREKCVLSRPLRKGEIINDGIDDVTIVKTFSSNTSSRKKCSDYHHVIDCEIDKFGVSQEAFEIAPNEGKSTKKPRI